MPAIINGGASGELNPGFDGSRGPVANAVAIVRRTSLITSIGEALSAQVTYGWQQVSGSARVVFPSPSGSLGSLMTVAMGAGNTNTRFHGTIRQFDTSLWPHAVTAVGKGALYALEEFKTDIESIQDGEGKPGIDLADLVGASTATLQQIVTAVLNKVGIGYSTSNLADPSHVYGLDGLGKRTWNDALVWGTHETAAAFIHRFCEASAGYRIFDSSDGQVYLKQVSTLDGIAGDLTFTLGDDIFPESTSSTSNLGSQSAVLVEGWDDGSGPATSGIVGSGSSAFRVFSNLIESDAFAQEIADFWLPQVNRQQRMVRLVTPRDDLIGPGSTVTVDAANGLGVSETMWVKSITTEVAQNGMFTQHLECVADAT